MKSFQYHCDSGVLVAASGPELAHALRLPLVFSGMLLLAPTLRQHQTRDVQGELAGSAWLTQQRRLVAP